MRGYKLAGILLLALVVITGCSSGGDDTPYVGGNDGGDGGDGNNNVPLPTGTLISEHGTTISHPVTDERHGQNCMECHSEGNHEYVYTIAGSVYQLDDLTISYPDATIKFYSEAEGAGVLLATLEVDANGNFYTTENIDISGGAYPVIEGTQGEPPIAMDNFITHGQCNFCHQPETDILTETRTLPLYTGFLAEQDVDRISEHGLTNSHTDDRRGTDCMNCHETYTVAGTVYDLSLENFYPDATVYLYDEPNGGGRLVETIEVDGNGNFYSTQNINFGTGLYPVIESADGIDLQHMPVSTITGACNSCHGSTVLPLYSGEKVNKLISQHGTTTSHTDERRGNNCMDCHTEGTGNPYIYTMAGTVYQQNDPTQVYPNATIFLYDKVNGKGNLIASIEVDNNGNFFTTESINFTEGLYPTIVGNSSLAPLHMPASTTTGECNGCHTGAGTQRIVVPGEPDQVASAHGTTFSHTDGRRGADCLGCHSVGGDNPYQYTIAGTVYEIDLQNFYPDATVSLYTGPDGTGDLIATIEVDSNGNFYTTAEVDLGNGQGNGVYPAVTGRDGTITRYMNEKTNDGSCSSSSCHSVNRPPIYAE